MRYSASWIPPPTRGEFRIRERPVAQGVLRPVARDYETRLKETKDPIYAVYIVVEQKECYVYWLLPHVSERDWKG